MLIQVDGSHHPWLEQRGPRFALLLAVDDATGVVSNAVFRQAEDTRGYFLLMEGLIRRWGIPLALYTGRHGVFKFSGRPRHVPRPVESTHFSRSIRELGVQQIFARSPQAKGWVERAAGTFQDRLVTGLRLAGASTIAQANQVLEQFIPHFNAQFAVRPELPDAAYRPVDPALNLTGILCFKHPRKVARDNTVKYNWRDAATAARRGPPQLFRSEGGGPGIARRQSPDTASRQDHSLPGGTEKSRGYTRHQWRSRLNAGPRTDREPLGQTPPHAASAAEPGNFSGGQRR